MHANSDIDPPIHKLGSHQPSFAIEVCCGQAGLSRALLDSGFTVLSVGHQVVDKAKSPIAILDLTVPQQQSILKDIVRQSPPDYVDFGMPCGACSRARDKPISEALRKAGAPNPRQLRSADFPMGLPDIPPGSTNGIRLHKANLLYLFVVDLLLLLIHTPCVISLENPNRSWFWAVMMHLILQTGNNQLIRFWDSLADIEFDACCLGSTRKKTTRWKSSPGIFDQLAKRCQNDHTHEPFQLTFQQGRWQFDAAAEAAYPEPLCLLTSHCAKQALLSQGRVFTTTQPLRRRTLAMQRRQHRKRTQLVPEFKTVTACQDDTSLTKFQTWMFPGKGEKEKETKKIGTYHTPTEFVELAMDLQHPMGDIPISKETLAALDWVTTTDPKLVVLKMKINVLKAKILGKSLESEERTLHEGLDPSVRKVVKNKRILLLEKFLKDTEFQDIQSVNFLKSGVPITGCHDHPSNFKMKWKAASLSEEELRSSATWRRKALMGRRPQTDEPGFLDRLLETAREEKELGFLDGPYHSEEVSKIFGHSKWSALRRFIVEQGPKKRPIDDGLEAQVNKAYTSTIDLELQDLDYVTSLALHLGKFPEIKWTAKCLDLSKAYKQPPLSPKDRELAVVYFKGPGEKHNLYIPNSLMFGATAAVFGFNRISKALWHLINRYLGLPASAYFDDYILFCPEEIAPQVDSLVSEFMSLLGWDHNLTGEKGQPFRDTFDVLGVNLNLKHLQEGTIELKNKEARIEKILEDKENRSRERNVPP